MDACTLSEEGLHYGIRWKANHHHIISDSCSITPPPQKLLFFFLLDPLFSFSGLKLCIHCQLTILELGRL